MTSTAVETPSAAETGTGPNPEAIQQFAGEIFGTLSAGATALMISVGHRTGLFDAMAGLPSSTSSRIAAEAGLHERYVREWLGAMTTARIVGYDPERDTYRLPPEHAAVLTRAAGADNLATVMRFLPCMGQVEEEVVRCFVDGGGVGYEQFENFHAAMSEVSAQIHDATVVDRVVPLVVGLRAKLETGIRVADIGCGRGRAMNLLARAFPASDFVGYDIAAGPVEAARTEAREWQLTNVHFETRDVVDLDGTGSFDAITAFDAIHDQAHPATVLSQIASHLEPDGVFLMVDMRASSHLHENLEIPWAPYLYAVSTMHCMTVSLAQGGVGLGTVWGVQQARAMLAEAGFGDVSEQSLEGDFINTYYVARL